MDECLLVAGLLVLGQLGGVLLDKQRVGLLAAIQPGIVVVLVSGQRVPGRQRSRALHAGAPALHAEGGDPSAFFTAVKAGPLRAADADPEIAGAQRKFLSLRPEHAIPVIPKQVVGLLVRDIQRPGQTGHPGVGVVAPVGPGAALPAGQPALFGL